MIIDLYAGPGGWSQGLRDLGHHDLGIELDPAACATRAAAGHHTIRADVTTWPLHPLAGRVAGLIASPPCQSFSTAGTGEGRRFLNELRADIDRGDYANGYPPGVAHVLQVGRWAEALRPRWIAAEQVPPVLPLWKAYARRFRALGYSAWAGVLNSADFGVPQTRKRAIVVASLDRLAGPPPATHARRPVPQLFGELAPWVSMAEALGWPDRSWEASNGNQVSTASPAQTVCGHREPAWMYPAQVETKNRQENADGRVPYLRSTDEPAPTLVSNADRWLLHTNRDQRPDGSRQQVACSAPAPTLTAKAGDPRITARCHHDHGTQGADAKTTAQVRAGDYESTEPIRLTITEALILQSFPPGYPVQGTKTKRFEQIGNAVPPRLAAHLLAGLMGLPVTAPSGG